MSTRSDQRDPREQKRIWPWVTALLGVAGALVITVVVLTLSWGPGSPDRDSAAGGPEGETVESDVGPSAGVGAELSERGAWRMSVGQPIQQSGQVVTVTAIRDVPLSTTCRDRYTGTTEQPQSANGRILALDMTIVNGVDYDDTTRNTLNTAPRREWVGTDGRAVSSVDADIAASSCLDTESVGPYGKGRTYDATIYVDVPTTSGYLLLGSAWDTSNQYEFEVPAA
ncbi:DUF4352 domain-containing protein [Pseudonocardia sp. WMMC193]|uniref:DUF4352 domain-containing protein n=1 Tax=Pseudonocardia sp. WMMC193 TaxID=2911965 RepID=UPI001F2100CF|nr:DUF4352 domain-containing protein [Pseudonocardia sp. WMMC193]MCF7547346.1 DUF4352 domain-containing protein [Pseudonocardia sp. WMMC193]